MLKDHSEKTKITAVSIMYKYVDGAHFFISDDEKVAGLCVASIDLRTAYDEVSEQLEKLYKVNHNIETKFAPALPFDAFSDYIRNVIGNSENYVNKGLIVPASIQPWQIKPMEVA